MRLTNLEARAARKRQSLKIGGRTRTDGTDGADWTHVDGLHGRDGTTLAYGANDEVAKGALPLKAIGKQMESMLPTRRWR